MVRTKVRQWNKTSAMNQYWTNICKVYDSFSVYNFLVMNLWVWSKTYGNPHKQDNRCLYVGMSSQPIEGKQSFQET